MHRQQSGAIPEIEVKLKGRVIVTVHGAHLTVTQIDSHADLDNMARIVGILTDIIDTTFLQMRTAESSHS